MLVKGRMYKLNPRCEIRLKTGCAHRFRNVPAKYIGMTIRPSVGIPEYLFEANLVCPNCGRESQYIYVLAGVDESSMDNMKEQMESEVALEQCAY